MTLNHDRQYMSTKQICGTHIYIVTSFKVEEEDDTRNCIPSRTESHQIMAQRP